MSYIARKMQQPDNLKVEKEAVRPPGWNPGRMQRLNGFLLVDLIHKYRMRGRNKLEYTRREYEREVGDMVQVFGELHFISFG